MQGSGKTNTRAHRPGTNARGRVLDQFAQPVQHAHRHIRVIRTIKLVRTAISGRKIHPRPELLIPPIFERLIPEQLPAQTRIRNILNHNIRIAKMNINPADLLQTQTNTLPDAILHIRRKHIPIVNHQRNKLKKTKLNRIEIFHHLVLALPEKIPHMGIALTGLLACQHRIENLFSQINILARTIIQKTIGKLSRQTRRVIHLALFPARQHTGIGIEIRGNWKRSGHNALR